MRDLRLAFRNLRAAPAYTCAALVTLALAIAANTAIFGVVYAVLLRPLPIDDPSRLVLAWETDPARGQPVRELTYRQLEGWARESRAFDALAGMSTSLWPVVLEGRGEPVRLSSTAVSGAFFSTLGGRALIGRALEPNDDLESSGYVAVLSHGTWMQRFGGDAAIVGTSVRLDRQAYTIVGVMPHGFDFPRGTEVWTPVVPRLRALSQLWNNDVLKNAGLLHAVGRLKRGVTMEAARDDLNRVAARMPYHAGEPMQTTVTPLLDHLLGPVRQGLWWLLAAVAVLMLVACANISGLTLTRAAVRRREHGIRLALGATRLQLARTWIAETTLLGVAGAVLGLTAARWVLSAIVALAPDDVPRIGDVAINLPVAGFTLLLALLTTVLCAAAAIAHSSSTRVAEVLNESARSTSSRSSTRTRSALVVCQIALAVVLLVSATLVAKSFVALRNLDVGYNPANVLTLAVEPSRDERPMREWFTGLLDRIEGLPGVESAATIYLRPLAYGAIGHDVSMLYEGQGGTLEQAIAQGAKNPKLNLQVASPEYFRTMRIPLLRGRLFDGRDHADTPRVVVLGESAARRLWPGQDPIGKKLNTPQHDGKQWVVVWHTVIGVVKDVHYRGINTVRLDIYEPASQSYQRPEFLVIRTASDPLSIAAAVQAQIRAHDAGAVVNGVTTLETILERALAPWRLSSWMLAIFAALAFLLAIVGLTGLVGLEVAQRLREFAVRLALGATSAQLRGHVLRGALARGLAGVALGVGAALAVTQWMRALLVGVSPADASTYAAVSLAVSVTVAAVSLVPAVRAARVEPIELLKRA